MGADTKHLAKFFFAALLLLGVALASPVHAQQNQVDDPALEEAYSKAFQELFKDPGNLDKSFRFAELAVQKGNFEAAISALERMLLINPDLPRVRLELGVLYFRIGSYAIARSYLTRVREAPDVPQEVLDRVDTFLAEIDNRLSRSNLSGSIFLGFRHSDNANAGPNSPNVVANGVAATLDDQFTNKTDNNYFVSAQINHSYDLLTQRSELLESSGTLYVSEQRRQKQLDIVFLEAQSGVRGPFVQTLVPGATAKPYVLGNMVYLQDSWYQFSVGLGFKVVLPLSQRLRTTANVEHKSEHFRNDSNRTTSSQQTGPESSLSVQTSYVLTETLQLGLNVAAAAQEAKESFNAFRELQVGVNATKLFPVEALAAGPVSVTGSVTRVASQYRSPNSTVDANRKRQDHEWRGSLTGAIPVTQDWTVIGTVQRTTVDSSLANFTYRATSITIGASRRF